MSATYSLPKSLAVGVGRGGGATSVAPQITMVALNYLELTTVHPRLAYKRNKTHKFLSVDIYRNDVNITKCGHWILVSLRTPRPTDIRCKLCFKA